MSFVNVVNSFGDTSYAVRGHSASGDRTKPAGLDHHSLKVVLSMTAFAFFPCSERIWNYV